MYVARYIGEHDHRRGQVGDPRCLPVVLVDTAYFCTYNKRGRNGDPIRLRESRANRRKHGLPLADAKRLDWDSMIAWIDDSQDYGEERWVGIAPLGRGSLHTVIFA